jgi:outer membrane protein assembly factor BamB
MKKTLFSVLCVCFLASASRAEDRAGELLRNWHQWRGPLANGVAPHGNPPLKWDQETNVKWKTPIPGRGSSTPIVWGDQVFILTAIDTGRAARPEDLPKVDPNLNKKTSAPKTYYEFVVLSIDRNTGRAVWKKTATVQVPHEGHHPTHSYAAASPTTDGTRLYVSFGSRGIYCYDLRGSLLWKRDLGRMNTRLGWGEGVSPVIHGSSLIVNWDQEKGSFITVLDARTGTPRWKKDRDEPTSWATPLVVERGGKTHVVVNGRNRVRSYDLATGRVLWECGGQTVNAIPSPVSRGGIVYCMSGYRGSAAYALPLDAAGDITGTQKIAWHTAKGTPYVPSPLLAGDRLYFTQGNSATLTALDIETGKTVLDRQRLPGLGTLYASPVLAGNRIYIADREGTTLVIQKADKLVVLARNKLDEPIDASLAIVGKQLFLRGEKHLYCLEEK